MMFRFLQKALLAFAPAILATPVLAQNNQVVYTYDALGRLVATDATATAQPSRTTIEYDAAGNRRLYTVTGSANASDSGSGASLPSQGIFIVVPLNGFTLIPVR